MEFSNFTSYADTVTGGATAAPSSSITVTPSGSDLTSLNLTLTFSSTSPVSAGSEQTSTLAFDYVVTPLSGYAITSAPDYWYFDYTGAGTVTTNGTIFPGTLPTTSPLAVGDNVEVLGGDPGTANLTSYEDFWYVGTAVTPVPATLPLFGSGLAVMGLLGWRRKRKNADALAAA